MFNDDKQFIKNFGRLDQEKKNRIVNELPISDVQLLSENGYTIVCHNGKTNVEKEER